MVYDPTTRSYVQSNRLLKITTDLGVDMVMLTELDGVDELSRPFLFKIRMVTDRPMEDVKALLSTAVTLEFGAAGTEDGRRPFRGYLRRLVRTELTNATRDEWQWEAEVVPRLWFLSLRTNMRIHKDITFQQIVMKMAGEYGIPTPVMRATSFGSTKLDFCVQYRESDLAFLSRIMERYGWFYFHQHDKHQTNLIVADANLHADQRTVLDDSNLISVEEDFSVQSGQWSLREFDPFSFVASAERRPTKISGKALNTAHERYDYVGAFIEKSGQSGVMGLVPVGRDLTDVAMEREEARHHLCRGASINAHLDAGRRATVAGSDVLVTAVTHRARDYSHWTDADWGAQERTAPFYENAFTCIPFAVPFRPEAITPRPVVDGPQTAKVTFGGDNPQIDKFGRVKLDFHWDREHSGSAWVRVSQGWAGKGHGQMHIPQTGDEVIVEFLEGDPDRPIVTGRVYNGKNTVPFPLPGEHTRSGIKTVRDNQLRFDDANGKEEVYIRAAKTLLTEVVDTETHKVGLGGTGDRITEIANSDTLTLKQGNLKIKATMGGVEIEAAQQIVLKVGASKLTVNQGGVTIEGTMIELKAVALVKINGATITIG
ncbi:type VI secretion system Vgr family protein [Roseomonas fluvialis]|uniref:Type VI secretion system tip protein VgrG n=1 Tax=Roseomonas fluvialis TaxID=1750527 RepID=A0ABM7Y868_9PROT|nr:type VI secretion system tip protein TssI/VgrG [Roseomonas fluvialis]BDG74216.1 hypothetical protein Rmf_41450 [Roseomonas fluvialis]